MKTEKREKKRRETREKKERKTANARKRREGKRFERSVVKYNNGSHNESHCG